MDTSWVKGKLDIEIRHKEKLFQHEKPQILGQGPKEVVRSPSLKILKTQLDRAWSRHL